jgi:predicted anti-sigma-YlaC factor YlaD
MLGTIGLSLIKRNAHLYEPAHRFWSLLNKNTHRFFITQICASSKSILEMELGAIIRSQRYRKTTLGITSIALAQLTFCEEGDTHMLR